MLKRFDVLVLGAGVLGLATAAELARSGRSVGVVDPGERNASTIAAGMIAPAMESLLDPLMRPHVDLLKDAARLWPEFAARHDLPLHREGASWIGPDAVEKGERLARLGFTVEIEGDRLTTPDDLRIDAADALVSLSRSVTSLRDRARRTAREGDLWRTSLASGDDILASTLVVATGAAGPIDGLPPAVHSLIASIQPIRGQIVQTAGRPERVLRSADVYWAPSADGGRVGATMEVGRRDTAPDPDITTRFRGAADAAFCGQLEVLRAEAAIRGATADGLPLVGAGGEPGLYLALAPRRNGWLLAPLVADTLLDLIERRPARWASSLDPFRTL